MINTLGPNFSPLANTVSPFSAVGREVVGLENVDAKNDLLAPVEESPRDEKALNQDENNENSENNEKDGQKGSRQQGREEGLQEEDLDELRRLQSRDAEVRAHEQAHASVGGQYAGAPSFSYQTGPNGVKYAVGGEVPISLPSSNGSPEQSIRAAEQVRRAALAPADPSGQDRRIAATASQIAQSARAEARVLRSVEAAEADAKKAERAEVAKAEKPDNSLDAQKEAQKKIQEEIILQQVQRKSVIESLRKANLLSGNLSTSENVAGDDGVGSLLDLSA